MAMLNFFGHALVAGRKCEEPAFVLGSMVPDLASMGRIRLAAVDNGALAEGVAFHHRTDTAFHGTDGFLSLCRIARAELASQGLPRPQSMAVAHVGVELMLDGVWARDGIAVTRFLKALDAAPRLGAFLHWHSKDGPARWAEIGERLRSRGAPIHYRDPEWLTAAIERALVHRPRLALRPGHIPIVRQCLNQLQPRVHDHSDALLQEVDAAMG